jgi:hypothetical protein
MPPREEREEAKSEDSLATGGDRTSGITISPQVSSNTSVRRGTGPRTLEGKERSKHNATRHGIFSSVVVLQKEARAEYESLLNSLWEALRPEGGLEELLVEKLAAISWRHRRLLVAEGAEIQRNTEFLAWDQRSQEQQEAEETKSSSAIQYNDGLMRKFQNPEVLERCIALLVELRQGLETDGFQEEQDTSILRKIYGNHDESHCGETLYDAYLIWLSTATAEEEERQSAGYATPGQCQKNMLQDIAGEIRRLKSYQKTRASIETSRTKLEILRRGVPDSPGLDRLLRYEASLERSFDRTLNQLERMQRMRLGQPVAPRIDVNLSA